MMCSDDVGGMKHDLTGGGGALGGAGALRLCDLASPGGVRSFCGRAGAGQCVEGV